jgi:pyruvate kinase
MISMRMISQSIFCTLVLLICHVMNSSLVLVLTESGTTARLVAKYRPKCPILTITPNEQTARQSLVSRGTFPLLVFHHYFTFVYYAAHQRTIYVHINPPYWIWM